MKPSNFIFDKETRCNGFEVKVPSGIRSKDVLLEELGKELLFPDYYGANWDAFEECLRDLSWVKEREILIRHLDIPLVNNSSLAKIYLSILSDAVEKWTGNAQHSLKILFPSAFKEKIMVLAQEQLT
jgi:RNAse (barnase) inhibitor barstar